VSAAAFVCKIRALEVGTEHERVALHEIRNSLKACADVGQRVSNEANERAGRSVSPVDCQCRNNLLDAVVEGESSTAVAMEVGEAGGEPLAIEVDYGAGIRRNTCACGGDGVALNEHPEVIDFAVSVKFARVRKSCGHGGS
jgi:hypothetical protein